MSVQAVGLFCQDIRVERENAVSIIGAMAETANLEGFLPGRSLLPRLALYVRINFDLDEQFNSISLKLQLPANPGFIDLGSVDDSVIKVARDRGGELGAPIATIFLRADMSPFPVPALGWLNAILSVDGHEIVIATLRFATGETNKQPPTEVTRHVIVSASASGQPVSQSPSAAPEIT